MDPELIEALGGIDGLVLSSPIEEHLYALAHDELLPVFSIGVLTVRAAEAGPALRAVLAKAAEGEPLARSERTLLFRGLHILGAARDSAAWPSLCRLLRHMPEGLEPKLELMALGELPRIVAGVFDGDVDAMLGLIMDPAAGTFIRHAVFGAATFLTFDGRIETARMRDFLVRFENERLAVDGSILWVGWVNAIGLLGLRDLVPLVHRAHHQGLVPTELVHLDAFETNLRATEQRPDDTERFAEIGLGYIEDVLLSMEEELDPDDGGEPFDAPLEISEPVRNPLRDVGRNDPCPCGSGKKAKKCCLATG